MVTALADAHLDGIDAVRAFRRMSDPFEQAMFERVRLRAAERSQERREELATLIANKLGQVLGGGRRGRRGR